MKFLAIISCWIFLIVTNVQAQNDIQYTQPKGSIVLNDKSLDTLSINYDFQFETFNQTHWSIDYIFKSNNFPKFLDIAFGNKMNSEHKENLIDIVDDIYGFGKKYEMDSFELLSIIISFSNSLTKINHEEYKSSDFYYPFELIFTGVHKEMDRQSLFAGILSMLCYDFSVVFRDKQMVVAVLAEDNEDVYYQDKKYKALLPYFNPQVEQVYGFDKICHFQKIYQDPVSSNIIYQLRGSQYMGDNQFALSNLRTSDQTYQAKVSLNANYIAESEKVASNPIQTKENKKIKGYVIKDNGSRLEIVSEIR